MEEERPSVEMEETVVSSEAEPTPDGENQPSGGMPKWIIIGFVVAAILIVAAFFMEPFSLGMRLGLTGGEETATAVAEDPTAVPAEATETVGSPSVPGEFEVMAADTAVSVSSLSAADLATAGIEEMPETITPLSQVYAVAYDGAASQGQVALTLPAAVEARVADLYGWDGAAWRFVAGEMDAAGGQIVSKPGSLHKAYALAQPDAPTAYTIGAEVWQGDELAPEILALVDEVTLGSLLLVGNGDLEGELATVPAGDYDKYLRVTNSGAIVDSASLSAFLNDTTAQGNQINTLVNTAASNDFAGINLDYQGVDASQTEMFTSFVSSLADALHAQDLRLIVTLGTPRQAADGWDTGGQNWAALGALADEVHVQLPLEPTAYGENGAAQALLDFAVREVDRTRLMLLGSANAVSVIGESALEMPNTAALANFGAFNYPEGSTEVEPGTAVEVLFTGEATPLEWDGASQTYRFSYTGSAEQTHHVWLGNPAALAQRLEMGEPYLLRGANIRGLGTIVTAEGYVEAINALGPDAAPQTEGAAIVWTVQDENESVLASESGTSLTYTWEGSEAPGAYTIKAEFALGPSIIPLGALQVNVNESREVAAAEIEPEEAPEEEPEEAAAAPPRSFDPGDADAVVRSAANVRTGPGLGYGILTGGAQPGTQVNVIGRNEESSWFNIVLPDDREGWIFSQLLELNAGLDVAALPVIEVEEPVAGGGGGGGGAPPPVSAPPVAAGGFELGGQTHSFANPQLMASAGMNWVKFQHKWGTGGNPGDLAGRINNAHAAGFKVLLSIPGANTYPDSINFGEYVQFLGGVAALGPDAIEVWNEMNIDFEWPAGQIDPASYVSNMLAPAYNAIKSANPNVMVISGAPAPTGFDNGTNAWSDSRYMQGMAAAGAANYLDCVGAHYNAGATSPSQNTGHPAGSDHYSWYLVPTLNVYAQLGKPVCFTELGYLSGEDYGGVPSRFSWASGTSVAQHAAWLAEAVSVAANTGRVRMIIVFNVDFTVWGDDPQAGYAMIRKDGSCPACSTLAQVMGR